MSSNRPVEDVAQRHGITAGRARKVASSDLIQWPAADVEAVLNQVRWVSKDRDPCGPCFNTCEYWPWWICPSVWLLVIGGASLVLPVQIVGLVTLLFRKRFRMIWTELPRPTVAIWQWGQSISSFVKTPVGLVQRAVEEKAALCINRYGSYKIMTGGYAVMSHVWGQTMGSNGLKGFGPVDLSLRKRGIYFDHFLKFFMRCNAEWLWVDVIAMPAVLEDMSSSEQEEVEKLRVGVINCLYNIYTRADKVVILDSMVLRLQTGSVVDVGRLRMVDRVHDSFVDLDEIVDFLRESCQNDQHRYYGLLKRIAWLRPRPGAGPITMEDIYQGCLDRHCKVELDQARALYPLLDLKWEVGWTLQQGLAHIKATFPEQTIALKDYCNYRSLEIPE